MAQAKAKQSATHKPAGEPARPHDPAPVPKWTHGKVYWSELMTHDVAKAKAFYQATLGWSFEPMPMDGYTYWIIKTGADMVGGLFHMTDPALAKMPDQWATYIAVDDVDARLKKAVAAGAQVMREPFDIPRVGRCAILHEPGGAMVCWMTPKT
jgi:uncharacterized protein